MLTIWGGNDAPPTLAEYEELGVRIALYPVMAATSGLQAAWELLCDFKERGTVALREWDARVSGSRWGRPDTKALLGADKIREIEEHYLPDGQRRDYASTWGHKTSYADAKPAPSSRSDSDR